jgi:hypothetical protein
MDNQKQGHFALFRSVLTTDWAKDIAKLALWVRLLGEATYRPRSVEFAGREWFLQPGQLVTTPAIMARKLRDQDNSEKSTQAVTRMLKFFTKEGMISTEGSPFGTVITITNYARYQGILGDEPSDNPSDKPQASNGAGLKVVADNPTDEPSDNQNKKVLNKNIKTNTPLPPEGGEAQVIKPERRKPTRINYDEYLQAFNEIVGERLPHAVDASAERQRKLRKLINSLATKNIDGFRAYVKAFMGAARPFHFGDNDREWVATFDYLLRPKVLTAIREGSL